MSSKMTKDEIKKALVICTTKFDCFDCPYRNTEGGCGMRLKCDILALITEQEEKIEQLTRNETHKTI